MRLHEFKQINELFNSSLDIEYDQQGNTLYASAYDRQGRVLDTTIGPGGIPGAVDIEFMRGGSFGVTGHGDAELVLGTVIKAIKHYFDTIGKPKYIVFHAKEDSRSSLYQALINRLAKRFGYVQVDTRNPPPDIADYLFSADGIFMLKLANI